MPGVMSAWLLLATSTPTPGPSSTPVVSVPDPDRVTPGAAGFFVMFLLALATIVLIRSMTKHLRKVRYAPDPAATDPGSTAPAAPGPGADDGEQPAEKAGNGAGAP
jgi:hypothetical protein